MLSRGSRATAVSRSGLTFAANPGVSLSVTASRCVATLTDAADRSTSYYADPVTVTGMLTRDASGQQVPLSGAGVQVIETVAGRAQLLATATSGSDGSVEAVLHPVASGTLSLQLPVDAGGLDYLALGDSFLAVERTAGEPVIVTDEREIAVRSECSQVLDGLAPGSPQFEGARARCIELIRARRNQPGGYWIAKDDPNIAEQAVVGRLPATDIVSATLLSNGASRIVDPYQLCRWQDLPGLLRQGGPDALIRSVRQAEVAGRCDQRSPSHKPADDASVAYCSALCK